MSQDIRNLSVSLLAVMCKQSWCRTTTSPGSKHAVRQSIHPGLACIMPLNLLPSSVSQPLLVPSAPTCEAPYDCLSCEKPLDLHSPFASNSHTPMLDLHVHSAQKCSLPVGSPANKQAA